MNMGGACSCSWAPNEALQHAAKAPERSVRGRPRREGGKGRGRQRCTVVGKIRRPTSAKGRRLKAMHAVSCIDIGPLTLLFELVDSAASYKRSRSLLRIFLSKLRKHDLEENRISLSTVGSKQSFLTEAFDRVVHRYESGTASESAKRALTSFRGFVQQRAPKNSFLRWLRATDDCPETFWGFRRRAQSLQSTPPLWQLHQSRMKSTCLLCSLQRMHDGWSELSRISNLR